MSATDYLSVLRNMRVMVAVEDGQLYATPRHRLEEPGNFAYLTEHAAQIVQQLGPCNVANRPIEEYDPVGDRVLFAGTGSRKVDAAASRKGFLGDLDDDLPAEAPVTPETPPEPPRVRAVDTSVRDVQVSLPASVRRLLDAAQAGRLPKGTVNVEGQIIADFPGYVQAYTINLLIGDQPDAMRRLLLAAAAVQAP